MTRNENHAGRRWAGLLAWLAGGLLLAVLLILDPLDLHPVDGWLRGGSQAATAEPADRIGAELWTCGMHPHVLEHGPGPCPICGMALVPVGPAAAGPPRRSRPHRRRPASARSCSTATRWTRR